MATKKVIRSLNGGYICCTSGDVYGFLTPEEALEDYVPEDDKEIVTMYELVPVAEYKYGGWQKVA